MRCQFVTQDGGSFTRANIPAKSGMHFQGEAECLSLFQLQSSQWLKLKLILLSLRTTLVDAHRLPLWLSKLSATAFGRRRIREEASRRIEASLPLDYVQ